MKTLTRRDFLKTAAIGSAGLAAMLALGCSKGGETSGSNAGNSGNAGGADTAKANEGASGTAGANNINEAGALNKDNEAAKTSDIIDIFRMHQSNGLSSLNPLTIKNASTGLYYSLYEMLFQNDDNMGGGMYPVLCDPTKGSAGMGGYDHAPGSTEYTVYLYENITDSKGNHITADDVKFSFTKTFEAGQTSGWQDAMPEDIEVVDDYTLTWHTKRELNKLGELENIWCRSFIFSQKAYEESPSQFATDACGTGHYTLGEFTVDSKAVLNVREDYWQDLEKQQQIQLANIKTIEYIQLSEAAQTVIALENGTLDFSQDLKADYLGDFMDGGAFADKFDIYSYLANMCSVLECNCDEKAITHDENLRKAIFWAVDNAGICKMMGAQSMSPVPFVGTSFFSDYDPDWEKLDNYNTRTDLGIAKEFLDKSNYKGEELRILVNNNQSSLGEIIMNMLGEIGIKINIQALDRATMGQVMGDPTQWELHVNMTAGDYMPTLWSHNHDFSNTAAGDHSPNFVYDRTWQDMLDETATVEGHTKEKLTAYVEYSIEHAYCMGLYAQYNYVLYPSYLKQLCFNDKLYLVPGGCVFEA